MTEEKISMESDMRERIKSIGLSYLDEPMSEEELDDLCARYVSEAERLSTTLKKLVEIDEEIALEK